MSDTPGSASDLPSSWKEEEDDALRADRSSRRWWVLGGIVLVVLVAAGIVAYVNRSDGPVDRAWPESYGGRPDGLGGDGDTAADVTVAADPGVYIWNGFDGWHIWVVDGDGLDGLKGTITSSDDIVSASSSAPDAGDATVDGKQVTFDLDGSTAVAGVDFDPGFSKELTFTIETDGGPVKADQVFTGSKPTSATSVPVVVEKAVVG
jgi:hypothetical protein